MTSFSHSGNLGDVIWSLPTVKHFGGGDFYIILNGVSAAIRKYNNGPVFPEYENRLSEKDYSLLAPLLEAQPYINKVAVYNGEKIDYDLDLFRGTVGEEFKTNFIETYAQTFNLPYDPATSFAPWLAVTPNRVAKFVVARTARYHSNRTTTIPTWITVMCENKVTSDSVFIGMPDEHAAFQDLFNVSIPYYKCKDFLDMAEVIAGADGFMSNQTFAYSIARGLGKQTVLETLSYRPLQTNECYFPIDNCYYF